MSALALRLARPEVLALPPFDIGTRAVAGLANVISLDANENPFQPLDFSGVDAGINRYREWMPLDAKAAYRYLRGSSA